MQLKVCFSVISVFLAANKLWKLKRRRKGKDIISCHPLWLVWFFNKLSKKKNTFCFQKKYAEHNFKKCFRPNLATWRLFIILSFKSLAVIFVQKLICCIVFVFLPKNIQKEANRQQFAIKFKWFTILQLIIFKQHMCIWLSFYGQCEISHGVSYILQFWGVKFF